MRLPAFVCLFVHLSVYEQDYSKTRACIWMKCCMSTIVGTWTNWLTFEPDPDYSPDAGISHISYALQRGILLRRENPTYAYWRGRSLQRGVVLKWFYSLQAVGTPLSEVRALYRVLSSCDILPKPKLCNTFEVASFNDCRNKWGSQFFGCSIPQPPPILVLNVVSW